MSNTRSGQFFDPWGFLEAWESRWQPLDDLQRARFVSEPKLLQILIHHRDSVLDSLAQFRSFDEIIDDLHWKSNQRVSSEWVEITPSDVGMAEPDPPWVTTFSDLGLSDPATDELAP